MPSVHLRPGPGATPIEVTLERADGEPADLYRATVGGGSGGGEETRLEVEIAPLSARTGWLRSRGRVITYGVVRRAGAVEVWLRGRRYVFEVVDRTARRAGGAAAAGAGGDLTAPMPGTILAIRVAPGDSFEAHEALIVMESMKMEMTLSAPAPGRVVEILCTEGELVEMGEILARLEPATGGNDGPAA